jgi:hypothetical protein
VHSVGVVPVEPSKELAIERVEVKPEVISMIVGKLFLYRAIETLCMSVLLRCLRAGVIVGEVQINKSFRKVLLELTAIVGENKGERKGEDRLAQSEEVCGCERCMRAGGKSKPKSGIEVNESYDIAPRAIDMLLEGVEGDNVTWIASD